MYILKFVNQFISDIIPVEVLFSELFCECYELAKCSFRTDISENISLGTPDIMHTINIVIFCMVSLCIFFMSTWISNVDNETSSIIFSLVCHHWIALLVLALHYMLSILWQHPTDISDSIEYYVIFAFRWINCHQYNISKPLRSLYCVSKYHNISWYYVHCMATPYL